MLEILALWALTKRIGTIVEETGRKSGWYKVLTIVLWFGGEFTGIIIGTLVVGWDESAMCLVYVFALLGAAAGAGIAYLIANNLSPIASPPPASLPTRQDEMHLAGHEATYPEAKIPESTGELWEAEAELQEGGSSMERARSGIEQVATEQRREAGKAPAAETLTGQSALAYRLAAVVLIVIALTNVAELLLTWLLYMQTERAFTTVIPVLIDLGLAVGLLQLRKGARTWTLIRAVFAAVVWPLISFISDEPGSAVIVTILQWGFCGPLILLLTGQSKTWRLVLAMAIFALVTLGLCSLVMLTAGLGFLM